MSDGAGEKAADKAAHENLAAVLSACLKVMIPKALKAEGYEADLGNASDQSIAEVGIHAAKDLLRLKKHQDDNIDACKLIGYLCFWIRKLKPIPAATKFGKGEKRDINERLSLWVMFAMFTNMLADGKVPAAADAVERIKKVRANADVFEYLVYSTRFRTFGPHHYAMILKLVTSL